MTVYRSNEIGHTRGTGIPYGVLFRYGGVAVHKLFLISGPSGSGKTTIMRQVLDNEVVSFTTRPMRDGETDGVDYCFITNERFEEFQANGRLVESSTYGGNHYGITSGELWTKTQNGPAFAIVDHTGMKALSKMRPDAVTVFIYALPGDCYYHMARRGSSAELISKRMSTYVWEWENRKDYAYVIRNVSGRLDDAVEIMRHIVHAEVGE